MQGNKLKAHYAAFLMLNLSKNENAIFWEASNAALALTRWINNKLTQCRFTSLRFNP
jgi:hypothetical protein